jgi:hypothetical protein
MAEGASVEGKNVSVFVYRPWRYNWKRALNFYVYSTLFNEDENKPYCSYTVR